MVLTDIFCKIGRSLIHCNCVPWGIVNKTFMFVTYGIRIFGANMPCPIRFEHHLRNLTTIRRIWCNYVLCWSICGSVLKIAYTPCVTSLNSMHCNCRYSYSISWVKVGRCYPWAVWKIIIRTCCIYICWTINLPIIFGNTAIYYIYFFRFKYF